jgi:hypothetical protein
MTLQELLQALRDTGDYTRLRLDAMAQFGTEGAPYLGAELLPEQLRDENAYTEQQVRYITEIANAGSSYSPAQMNTGGRVFGEFKVSFGNTNVADQITANEYDRLMKLIMMSTDGGNDNATMQAMLSVMRFLDRNIREPMLMLNELYRWQAIIDGVVKRRGSNGYSEDVVYPVLPGHRVTVPGGTQAAPAGWYNPTVGAGGYDAAQDLFGAQRFLAKKGYKVNRMVSDYEAAWAFLRNPAVVNRVSGQTIVNDLGGSSQRIVGNANMDAVNSMLLGNMLPRWEIYDRTYNYRSNGNNATTNVNAIETARFLERVNGAVKTHAVVLVCSTGRNEDLIDFGDRSSLPNGGITLPDTLGYYGIGKVAGQPTSGRHMYENVIEKHPGGLYAECIQEGLPVITEPEAMFVINVAEPTP